MAAVQLSRGFESVLKCVLQRPLKRVLTLLSVMVLASSVSLHTAHATGATDGFTRDGFTGDGFTHGLSAFGELKAGETRIEPAFGDELRVAALRHDAPALEDQDAVGRLHGGEAVGDDQRGAPFGELFECCLHDGFGFGVARGAGLIVLGLRLRPKRLRYGQALMGGGLAVLYTTLFAAFQLYDLLSYPVAFGAMLGVTALGFVLAYR